MPRSAIKKDGTINRHLGIWKLRNSQLPRRPFLRTWRIPVHSNSEKQTRECTARGPRQIGSSVQLSKICAVLNRPERPALVECPHRELDLHREHEMVMNINLFLNAEVAALKSRFHPVRYENNLENVDATFFDLECQCGWQSQMLGVQAKKHWTEPAS